MSWAALSAPSAAVAALAADLPARAHASSAAALQALAAGQDGAAEQLEALHAIAHDPSLPDMYRRTAANIMNMTVEEITKKHPFRQSIGKTSELALGFQGSVSAFYTMARNYGVDLNAVYAPVWENADEEQREIARFGHGGSACARGRIRPPARAPPRPALR